MSSYQAPELNSAAHLSDGYGNSNVMGGSYASSDAAPNLTESRAYDGNSADVVQPPREGNLGDDFIKTGKKAFRTPKGMLRLVTFLLSLISFACGAAFPHSAGAFNFLIAANVLAWLYTIGMIFAYGFRKKLETMCGVMPMVEFAGDGILALFTFIAAATSASLCNNDWSSECNKEGVIGGAIAFSFLTAFAFIALMVLSYMENRRLESST